MKHYSVFSLVAGCLLLLGSAVAQTPAGSTLPRLVRFSGTARDTGGKDSRWLMQRFPERFVPVGAYYQNEAVQNAIGRS